MAFQHVLYVVVATKKFGKDVRWRRARDADVHPPQGAAQTHRVPGSGLCTNGLLEECARAAAAALKTLCTTSATAGPSGKAAEERQLQEALVAGGIQRPTRLPPGALPARQPQSANSRKVRGALSGADITTGAACSLLRHPHCSCPVHRPP